MSIVSSAPVTFAGSWNIAVLELFAKVGSQEITKMLLGLIVNISSARLLSFYSNYTVTTV
jgi:hypothetical protein